MMAAGRQCSIVHAISRGAEKVLTPTVMAPSLPIAKAATSHSGRLGRRTATRSPFRTPTARSARASSSARARRAPYVSRRSRKITASASGRARAVSSSRSPSVRLRGGILASTIAAGILSHATPILSGGGGGGGAGGAEPTGGAGGNGGARDRLHGRPGLREADGLHPRRLQGRRRLEGRPPARRCDPRRLAGSLRRSPAQRVCGASQRLEPERRRRRGAVSAGARAGAGGASRLLPHGDARDRLRALAAVGDSRWRENDNRRARVELHLSPRRVVGARPLGPDSPRGRVQPGQRPGKCGGPRDEPPQPAGGAGAGLLSAACARRAEAAARRHGDGLPEIARADAEPV